jgi:O-acetyl-ADP-ribose deacetylase (regulator of RNase III)
LLKPQPTAETCHDCGGLAPPAVHIKTAKKKKGSLCKGCQRFRAVLGAPEERAAATPSRKQRGVADKRKPAKQRPKTHEKRKSAKQRRRTRSGRGRRQRGTSPTSKSIFRSTAPAAADSSSATSALPHRGLQVLRTVRLQRSGAVLVVARGSVTTFMGDGPNGPASAIVNAANVGCQGGGGVDGAITLAGGRQLRDARAALKIIGPNDERCLVGGAVTTIGGDLDTTYCIHAVGPDYRTRRRTDGGTLVKTYRAALEQAKEHKVETIAFPLLSSGIFLGQQPILEVLQDAVNAIEQYAYSGLREVYLVVYGDTTIEHQLVQLLSDLDRGDPSTAAASTLKRTQRGDANSSGKQSTGGTNMHDHGTGSRKRKRRKLSDTRSTARRQTDEYNANMERIRHIETAHPCGTLQRNRLVARICDFWTTGAGQTLQPIEVAVSETAEWMEAKMGATEVRLDLGRNGQLEPFRQRNCGCGVSASFLAANLRDRTDWRTADDLTATAVSAGICDEAAMWLGFPAEPSTPEQRRLSSLNGRNRDQGVYTSTSYHSHSLHGTLRLQILGLPGHYSGNLRHLVVTTPHHHTAIP